MAQLKLNDVWAMLDACAPGHKKKQGRHRWRVLFNDRFCWLPLGAHGHRRNPEIEVAQVQALARQFDIVDCANREISSLNAKDYKHRKKPGT